MNILNEYEKTAFETAIRISSRSCPLKNKYMIKKKHVFLIVSEMQVFARARETL